MTLPRIPIAAPVIGEEEIANVMEAMRSGWISSLGAFIGQFERDFAAFCGTAHGVAVANGTVSLHLALVAAGVGPGDEVVIPSLTFVATANVVRNLWSHSVIMCGHFPEGVETFERRSMKIRKRPITRGCSALMSPLRANDPPCPFITAAAWRAARNPCAR